MSESTATTQLRLLRAQVESRLSAPSVIVVTSAQERDGKTATAYGLAEAFAAANYRTAIVNAGDHLRSRVSVQHRTSDTFRNESIHPVELPISNFNERLDEITIPTLTSNFLSRDAIQLVVDEFRDRYDFTIIDATHLLKSDTALLFAGTSSGTLIAARIGRPRVADDHRMMTALTAVNANVLGVVAVSERTIAEFSRSQRARLVALPDSQAGQHQLQVAIGGPAVASRANG